MARPAHLVACEALVGERIANPAGELLGTLAHVALELPAGRIAYAVLSHGGVFGIGEKLFAIPWDALQADARGEGYIVDIPREALERSRGFDRDHWPAQAETVWLARTFVPM